MLREQILSVEVIEASGLRDLARVLRITRAQVAAVEAELQVLGCSVSFPLVLVREDRHAAESGERAGKGLMFGCLGKRVVAGVLRLATSRLRLDILG